MGRKKQELTFNEEDQKVTEESITWEDVNSLPEELDESFFIQDVEDL